MRKLLIGFHLLLAITTTLVLLAATPAWAGHWQVAMKSTGEYQVIGISPESGAPGQTETMLINDSWTNIPCPPFLNCLFSFDPTKEQKADITYTDTFNVTITWVSGGANDPPPTKPSNLVLSGNASWVAFTMDGDLLPTYQGSASDGLGDAYTSSTAGGGTTASGGSVGSHLKTYDGSSGTITFTVSQSITLNLGACTVPYTVNSGCSISVCLLADLDPFPDNLANSDPVVLYHGTDLDMATLLAADSTNIGAYGGVDFGAGFYTLDYTALDMAKFFAQRTAANKGKPYWGVVEFDVPLQTMLDFFCDYQDIILGYKDTTDLSSPASWNSPAFPVDVPEPNFTPNTNPANQPIPNGQINWANFAWYNYWYDKCILGNPAPTGMDNPNYVPDWNILADHYDWGYALIWGNFYRGPGQNDCGNYRRGGLFGGRLGVIYQYAWGWNHYIDLFNQRDTNGNLVVKRSIIR